MKKHGTDPNKHGNLATDPIRKFVKTFELNTTLAGTKLQNAGICNAKMKHLEYETGNNDISNPGQHWIQYLCYPTVKADPFTISNLIRRPVAD